ncbi:MAG: NAD(P)/FAD-dependent oxidoreductase, partial [Verrucomicrobiales bacterium]
LGVIPEMDRLGFTQKLSVQFVTQDGGKSQPFYFFQHHDHPSSTTWQVNRDEFDLMLLENAESKGAQVRQETKVRSFLKGEAGEVIGVEAEHSDGQVIEYFAPITIDATGRDSMAVTKNRWRERDPKLNKVALWTYYRGAMRDEGLAAGSTTVAYLPERGWFWYIPLKNDIVSVGIVAERDYLFAESRDPATVMANSIEDNAWIKDHLSVGEQFGEYWVTGEYSYRSRYCATDGLMLVGDAFAFLDPVFSSGVFFALKSGQMAADAVHAALEKGDTSASQFDSYGQQICEGVELMRKIVYAFYDESFSFGKLIRKYPDLRPDLTDCLIGNLEKHDFQELVSAMGEFAQMPGELAHGRRGLSVAEPAVLPEV